MRRLRFVSSIAAAAIGVAGHVRADELQKKEPSQADALWRDVRDVVERSAEAICSIESDDEHGHLRGTGFFVDADGTLLTSYGVGGTSEDIVVGVGEQRIPATRLVADARAGIAILKVACGRPMRFLKLGETTDLAPGTPVVTAGYPLDLPLSPSFGLVAGMDIKYPAGNDGRFFATRHIRANVPVQRGQGGSPVMTRTGEVVGIIISMVDENSGVFALPVEAAQKVIHDFRTYGRVRQGWVGVDIRENPAAEGGSTARVQTIREDGPAYSSGVRAGDTVLKIGRFKISNPEDALNAAFFLTATEPFIARILRNGEEHEFTITPVDPRDGAMPTVERQIDGAPVGTTGGQTLNLNK
jgi:serine protease Do